jgi:hypothetical protein
VQVRQAVVQQGRFGADGLGPAADRGQQRSQDSMAAAVSAAVTASALATVSSAHKGEHAHTLQMQVCNTCAETCWQADHGANTYHLYCGLVAPQVTVTNAQQPSQKMQGSSVKGTEAVPFPVAKSGKQLSLNSSAPTPGPPPKVNTPVVATWINSAGCPPRTL